MSESTRTVEQDIERIREIEQRRQEYQRTFSYDGYKTVRKELFAHLRDPAFTITPEGITFNTACINSFKDIVYIKPHINEELKRFAITPCSSYDKNALRWCVAKPDKRKPRKIIGRPFSKLLYRLMDWEPDHRYKVMGFRIEDKDGTPVYVFDLTIFEGIEIVKLKMKKAGVDQVPVDKLGVSGNTAESFSADNSSEQVRPKPQLSKKALSSFGDSVEETNRMMGDNSMKGYRQIEFLR